MSSETNPVLSTDGVSVFYESNSVPLAAVVNASLQLHRGRVHLLLGPSGSGKTTLLSVLGGLLKPNEGTVFLEGNNLYAGSQKERSDLRLGNIGFVFQSFRLLSALTALQNVALPLELGGTERQAAQEFSAKALERFGLANKMRALPQTLSGGERQRVAIARATVGTPQIILADEPTANLDHRNSDQVAAIFKELSQADDIAVLIVTHDARLRTIADTVITMEDGRIVSEQSS